MTEPWLTADCARCAALCCVVLPFARSADFAFTKPAGVPCRHLTGSACGIHDRLRTAGFPGCAAYDCFGAGQRVSASTADARKVFPAMRALHELLWYLREARGRDVPAGLRAQLDDAWTTTLALADALDGGADDTPVAAQRASVAPLLRAVSRHVRGDRAPDRSGTDLAGADLRGTELTRTDLRNATLVGADLRAVDLTFADLLGADLRGADVRGADLSDALYLTRSQLGATRTDSRTRVPAPLRDFG